MSKTLATVITPVPRYARASNLERDSGLEAVTDYHLIEPSLGVLRRILRSGPGASSTRAWVVTGPYGSGKSTFALFLDALMGPSDDPVTRAASGRLAEVDPALAGALADYKDRLGADRSGTIRAIATGRPEPISETVLRALATGLRRQPGGNAKLRQKVADARDAHPTPELVARLFAESAQIAPISLVIDELGVVLDAAGSASGQGLWLLQELAEVVSQRQGPTGFVLGLQHRSLVEQLDGSADLPTDWRKIQGRFEEIVFVESREEVFSLIPRVLRRRPAKVFDLAVDEWASDCLEDAHALGLGRLLPGSVDLIAACYPLHPSVLLVLPDLTTLYGQRERTLLAFVAGNEPDAVGTFLDEHELGERPLPVVDLPRIYDFFVGSGSHRLGSPSRVSRWAEVERRIREAEDLDALSLRVLRTVGLLNLVGRGGPVRASDGVLEYAVPGAKDRIGELVRGGLLTYRAVTDEYRLWEGSDVDLEAAVSAHRTRLASQSLSALLTSIVPLPPVVAVAHSERTGILRTLERCYATEGDTLAGSTRDGLIAYYLGTGAAVVDATSGPVIVLQAADIAEVRYAAIEAGALGALFDEERIRADWVALREVRERYSLALDVLRGVVDKVFDPEAIGAVLYLDQDVEEAEADLLSRIASLACDRTFPNTPRVRNEMFSVHELTSQGARARGLLMAGMIEHGDSPQLGFDGWGPERAMYESLFHAEKLHRAEAGEFGPASSDAPYAEVWHALRRAMFKATHARVPVEDLLTVLERRPFGLRRSLSPVLWLAVFLRYSDQLALYEDGSFVSRITPDAIERLVKAPDEFSVKYFAARGNRARLVDDFDRALALTRPGPGTLVGVVTRLIASLRSLPEYTMRSRAMSDDALAVRDAILAAREPDVLIFESLPTVLGFSPVEVRGPLPPKLVPRVVTGIVELGGAFRDLQGRVKAMVADAFSIPAAETLRTDLRVRSQGLLGVVAEPRIRGFLAAASNSELDDGEWLGSLVVAAGGRPLPQWADADEASFGSLIREMARAHRRLVILHDEVWAEELTDGFEARRITITEADGHEMSRLVWVDAGRMVPIREIVDQALAEAGTVAGADGARMLLALLTQRLVESERDDEGSLPGENLELA